MFVKVMFWKPLDLFSALLKICFLKCNYTAVTFQLCLFTKFLTQRKSLSLFHLLSTWLGDGTIRKYLKLLMALSQNTEVDIWFAASFIFEAAVSGSQLAIQNFGSVPVCSCQTLTSSWARHLTLSCPPICALVYEFTRVCKCDWMNVALE